MTRLLHGNTSAILQDGDWILLNGAGDTNPPCRYQTDPTCEGPWYTTATGTTTASQP